MALFIINQWTALLYYFFSSERKIGVTPLYIKLHFAGLSLVKAEWQVDSIKHYSWAEFFLGENLATRLIKILKKTNQKK